MNDFVIWWLSQDDCEAIGDHLPDHFPEYIRDEYRSRLGRSGRGRLWVSDSLGLEDFETDEWPDTPLAKLLSDDYGGIVIRAADSPQLAIMPGIITTTAVQQLAARKAVQP